jgi:hypothetical protein
VGNSHQGTRKYSKICANEIEGLERFNEEIWMEIKRYEHVKVEEQTE